jgi:hypothetical protein
VRKFRATFIALAIVLVLAAYMVFTGREQPAVDMDAPMIFGVNSDSIRKICIAHGDNKVTVEKDNDRTWVVDAPGTYEISQEAVNALVLAIAEAKFEKEIEADPSDLEAFGLSSPDTRIVVEGDRRGKKTLLIGSVTPVGSGYYVKSGDDTKVWVIPTTVADALMKTVCDLREKKIVKVSAESCDGIRIVRRMEEDMTDVICQKQGEDWYLVRPIIDKADKERIDELLADITGITVESFVDDEGSDLSRWGLDRPRLRIDLTVAGRGTALQVFVGDPGPNEEGFYIKTGDSPAVYLVKPWDFSPLEITPPDLVDSQLAKWDHDKVITATWMLGDESFPPVSSGLDTILATLQDIRITGVGESLEYDVDLDSLGFRNPRICVQLDLGDGNIFEVKVGKEIEEGFYAIATGRNFVYLVAKDGIEALDETLRELSP